MAKNQVTALLGVGDTRLWEWLRDGVFPAPIEIGPPGGRSSTICWFRVEIEQWLASRPRRQFGQHEFRGRRKDEPEAPPPEMVDDEPVARGVHPAMRSALAPKPKSRRGPEPNPELAHKQLTGVRVRPGQRAVR